MTDPADVKTVFADSDAHQKALNNDAGWLMGELLGNCLGLISGAEYRHLHRSISGAFTHRSAAESVSRMTEITVKYLSDLRAKSDLSQGTLYPARDLRMLPFWIVANYMYGSLDPIAKQQLADMIHIRESLFRRVIQGGPVRFPWSRYLPTRTTRDLEQFKTRWKAFNDSAYEACVLSHKNDTPLVRMYEAMRSGSITADQTLHTLDEMLFGNLDVTVGGMSWNFFFLAAHQQVQAQIRAEIRQARGTGWEDYLVSSTTLLAASILESARLKPIAAFSIPQAAPTDRKVGGFLVPAGTNFVVDTHALNIRNKYWGDDGAQYRPSRFQGRKESQVRYHYWRFGFGPRKCLGRYAADLMIRILIAHIVENYGLDFGPATTWDKDPTIWITQPNTPIHCTRLTPGLE